MSDILAENLARFKASMLFAGVDLGLNSKEVLGMHERGRKVGTFACGGLTRWVYPPAGPVLVRLAASPCSSQGLAQRIISPTLLLLCRPRPAPSAAWPWPAPGPNRGGGNASGQSNSHCSIGAPSKRV